MATASCQAWHPATDVRTPWGICRQQESCAGIEGRKGNHQTPEPDQPEPAGPCFGQCFIEKCLLRLDVAHPIPKQPIGRYLTRFGIAILHHYHPNYFLITHYQRRYNSRIYQQLFNCSLSAIPLKAYIDLPSTLKSHHFRNSVIKI